MGRKVILQQLNGSSWKKVGTAKQEKNGSVNFAALVSKGGLPLTYRVQATKFKGLKATTSKTVDTSQWLTPTFTDEFSGSTLGPVWSHRGQDYEPPSKRVCSKGDPKATKVGGGALRLSVIKDKSRSGKCTAKSRKETKKISYRLNGHVGTAGTFDFKYGVAAARIKMQKMQGQHASFWMQPVGENQPGSDGHEIDIIEYFGDKHPQGGLTSFIHWYKGNKPDQDRLVDQELGVVPEEQEGRLVEELPRLLGPVDPEGDHLPHRRQGDLAHVGPRLQGPAVPHPQPARLRLRGARAAGQEAAAAHVRRLGARLGDPGLLTRSQLNHAIRALAP